MSAGELYYGAAKSAQKDRNRNRVDEFCLSVNVIHTDIEILNKFGELKADLSTKKISIPDAELFIASIALIKCKKLITGNIKHFKHFDHLIVENWFK